MASRVEFPQQLIPDERIRIATDHAVPRDHVVGLNVHARTKPVLGAHLGIIGFAPISLGVNCLSVGAWKLLLHCVRSAEE